MQGPGQPHQAGHDRQAAGFLRMPMCNFLAHARACMCGLCVVLFVGVYGRRLGPPCRLPSPIARLAVLTMPCIFGGLTCVAPAGPNCRRRSGGFGARHVDAAHRRPGQQSAPHAAHSPCEGAPGLQCAVELRCKAHCTALCAALHSVSCPALSVPRSIVSCVMLLSMLGPVRKCPAHALRCPAGRAQRGARRRHNSRLVTLWPACMRPLSGRCAASCIW